MSFLPKIKTVSSPAKVESVAFYGLDRNENAKDGYFSFTQNVSSRDFPFISSRDERKVTKLPDGFERIVGTLSSDNIYFIAEKQNSYRLYMGSVLLCEWESSLKGERIILRNDRFIYVFPDKVYYRFKDEAGIEEYKNTHNLYGQQGEGYIRVGTGDALTSSACSVKEENAEGLLSIRSLAVHDCIKLWAYEKGTQNKVSFHNLSIDDGVIISEVSKSATSMVITFEDEVFSVQRIDATYGGYETKAFSTSLYVKIGFEHTHPREYDEAFGYFALDAESCELYTDSDNDYFVIIPKKLKEPYSFNPYEFIDKNFDDGMEIRFSSVSSDIRSVFPESAVIKSQNADIPSVGVRKFYHGNNHFFGAYLAFPKGTFTVKSSSWQDSDESGVKYIILYDGNNERAYISAHVDYPMLSGAAILNNRLWGYDGKNYIYASKLGKPYILKSYKGISTDSWSLDTGFSEGITGVYIYGGIPVFFTEKRIVKVYGSQPSEFRTAETDCFGLKKSGSGALCECGGVLFYLDSRGKICAYTGAYPEAISERLNASFEAGRFSSDGKNVYCLCDSYLYIFDSEKRMWLCEGKQEAEDISSYGVDFYIFKGNLIYSTKDFSQNGDFESYIEKGFTSIIEFPVNDEGIFNHKKLKALLLKINAKEGTSLCVEVKEADGIDYRRIFDRVIDKGDGVLTIPVNCQRTLGYSIRISAKGAFRLEGVMRKVSIGSYKD